MQYTYMIDGGTPLIKKYKTAASHVAGIIVLVPAAGATGVSVSTTTSWAASVGLTLDRSLSAAAPIAYSTVQGDPEPTQSVIVSPGAVLRALLVASATDAVLVNNTILTASSDGLTAVGTNSVASPSMDEGMIWYIAGSNGGASRIITSVSSATATVIVPFAANRVGDIFLAIDYTPGVLLVTMNTALTNVRGDLAATGAAAACIDLELNGNDNSYLHLVQTDHAFASS